MKDIIIAIVLSAASLAACNNSNDKTNTAEVKSDLPQVKCKVVLPKQIVQRQWMAS